MPVDRRPVGVVVERHAPLPDREDDHGRDQRKDDDGDDGREPVQRLDAVELLRCGGGQPLEEDGHQRERHADHDPDGDELDDALAHRFEPTSTASYRAARPEPARCLRHMTRLAALPAARPRSRRRRLGGAGTSSAAARAKRRPRRPAGRSEAGRRSSSPSAETSISRAFCRRSSRASASTLLAPIKPVLASADVAVVNLETAVTNSGFAATKEFVFRAPPNAFAALRGGSVDVASLANNHGMDYGSRACATRSQRLGGTGSRSSERASTRSARTRPTASP